MDQQKQPSIWFNGQEAYNAAYWVTDILSITVEPISHYGQGKRAYTWRTWISLLVLLSMCRSAAFMLYIKLWCACVVWRKYRYDKRQLSGFCGIPLVAFWCRNDRLAHVLGVVALYPIGGLVGMWAPDVGQYLRFCMLPFGVRLMMQFYYLERREDIIADGFINMTIQQQETQLARKKRGI